MIHKNSYIHFFKVILALSLLLMLYSCQKKLGVEIPTDIKPTPYTKIKANPKQFVEKKILLKGTVGPSCCPAQCELSLKTGSEAVNIYPDNFKFKKVKTGTPVKLYVKVIPGEERTVITALGVEYL